MTDSLTTLALLDPPVLTVVIGACCSDGIVIVADRKFVDSYRNFQKWGEKTFGDVAHVIMGYAGNERTFDLFRKYVVGDVVIRRDGADKYTDENILSKISPVCKWINGLKPDDSDFRFEVLVALHSKRELYWMNSKGETTRVTYKAIGSGRVEANTILSGLPHSSITMKEFAPKACFAIRFAEAIHPELGVGTGEHYPIVKYLPNNETWDWDAPQQDLKEFVEYAEQRLKKHQASLTSPDS